jgi:GntR family transcriptional regulator
MILLWYTVVYGWSIPSSIQATNKGFKSVSKLNSLQKSVTNHTPLYLQVQQTLKEMIEDVEFGPGDRIPAERELSEMLDVSRMTVRRAVENLIESGLLERRSTSGTFVREPQVVRHVGGNEYPIGITQLLEQEGSHAGSRLLAFEMMRVPRKVADYLNLRVGENVIMHRRLRLVNDVPFCIETGYLASELVPGLAENDFSENKSFFGLLRQRYGIDVVKSEGIVKLSRCTQEEADLLELEPGDPVMFMRSVSFDPNDRRVEYMKSINHPDRVAFRTFRQLIS